MSEHVKVRCQSYLVSRVQIQMLAAIVIVFLNTVGALYRQILAAFSKRANLGLFRSLKPANPNAKNRRIAHGPRRADLNASGVLLGVEQNTTLHIQKGL